MTPEGFTLTSWMTRTVWHTGSQGIGIVGAVPCLQALQCYSVGGVCDGHELADLVLLCPVQPIHAGQGI